MLLYFLANANPTPAKRKKKLCYKGFIIKMQSYPKVHQELEVHLLQLLRPS